jgi:hypothetical protein
MQGISALFSKRKKTPNEIVARLVSELKDYEELVKDASVLAELQKGPVKDEKSGPSAVSDYKNTMGLCRHQWLINLSCLLIGRLSSGEAVISDERDFVRRGKKERAQQILMIVVTTFQISTMIRCLGG